MIDRVILKDPLRAETRFFRDRQTKSEFTDIIGSWSWPERLDGHLLVFALSRQPQIPRRENRIILCMQEFQLPDISTIVSVIGASTKFFKVQEWVADTNNLPAFEAFALEQDRLPRNVERIWPVEAPFARDIRKRYMRYAHIIRDQLPRDDKKPARLHFGNCETARISTRQISIEKNTTVEDFPVVAALGFGVAHMRIHRGGTDEA